MPSLSGRAQPRIEQHLVYQGPQSPSLVQERLAILANGGQKVVVVQRDLGFQHVIGRGTLVGSRGRREKSIKTRSEDRVAFGSEEVELGAGEHHPFERRFGGDPGVGGAVFEELERRRCVSGWSRRSRTAPWRCT